MSSIAQWRACRCSKNLPTTRRLSACWRKRSMDAPCESSLSSCCLILHFVLWPEHDRGLTNFCRWLAHTQSMRWHAHYPTSGTGPIYQGRFQSFAVESDEHFYTVCRYVERNPLRAKLVQRAEDWHWSSLWRRIHGDDQPRNFLCPWPLPRPEDWIAYVNAPQTDSEWEVLRCCVQRGCPFGSPRWQKPLAARLGLSHTLRPLGRPKKAPPQEDATA